MIFNKDSHSAQVLGETYLIKLIEEWLGNVNPAYPNGIGDDCAVIQTPEGNQLLTTDTITYGIHFDDSVSARNAGEKLIKRNISDIAAMGGIPQNALLNLLCAPNTSVDWLEDFFQGIRLCCQKYKISLVGGDISSLPRSHFSATLTLTGICQQPKLRRTSLVGDSIYVTGTLGGSLLGKHYRFEPRLKEGQWLAKRSDVTAMMDLTDGLAKDLKELLPKGTQASLHLDQIPLTPEALLTAPKSKQSALEHAFQDGEDYELLFCSNADEAALLEVFKVAFPSTPLHRIGQIIQSTSSPQYLDAVTGEAIPWIQGYEHLS